MHINDKHAYLLPVGPETMTSSPRLKPLQMPLSAGRLEHWVPSWSLLSKARRILSRCCAKEVTTSGAAGWAERMRAGIRPGTGSRSASLASFGWC